MQLCPLSCRAFSHLILAYPHQNICIRATTIELWDVFLLQKSVLLFTYRILLFIALTHGNVSSRCKMCMKISLCATTGSLLGQYCTHYQKWQVISMRSHIASVSQYQCINGNSCTSLLRFTSKRAIPCHPTWIHCITRCLIVMGMSLHHWNGLDVSKKHRSIYLAQSNFHLLTTYGTRSSCQKTFRPYLYTPSFTTACLLSKPSYQLYFYYYYHFGKKAKQPVYTKSLYTKMVFVVSPIHVQFCLEIIQGASFNQMFWQFIPCVDYTVRKIIFSW